MPGSKITKAVKAFIEAVNVELVMGGLPSYVSFPKRYSIPLPKYGPPLHAIHYRNPNRIMLPLKYP